MNVTDTKAIKQMRQAANNLREEPSSWREQNQKASRVLLAMANFFEYGSPYIPQVVGYLDEFAAFLEGNALPSADEGAERSD